MLPRLRDFKSVLIVKPSSLGDIVHTLPAVRAIRQASPHLRVRWLANTEWMPLLRGSPVVDEVLEFPRKRFRGLVGLLRFGSWRREWMLLPREEPELVLDFQGLLRSGLCSSWRGSQTVLGLSDAREGARFFYDQTVPVDTAAHAVDRYLELPRALGVEVQAEDILFDLAEGGEPSFPGVDWRGSIVLHPWSRGQGKSLTDEAVAALCESLAPLPVILVGMHEGAQVPQAAHVRDLSHQTSLAELVWVMRQARGCISVDSGPLHIAAAVNERVLGLHTWSDPRKVGPYPQTARVWKAGVIAPRAELSVAQCLEPCVITTMDAHTIGQWARTAWT